MSAWLSRNAAPIGLVLVATALVIGGFEIIDALADSAPVVAESEDTEELAGIASLAGLIKVTLFLGVGALIAIPIRRRFGNKPAAAEAG